MGTQLESMLPDRPRLGEKSANHAGMLNTNQSHSSCQKIYQLLNQTFLL